jgi:D-alanyl-D-alanine carboxypeptidase (penicillin-binding protein 5/6)
LAIPADAQQANPAAVSVNAPPTIKASSALLVDAQSGQVLFEKNADSLRPPASTTKIMTAILLLENTSPDDRIRASKAASEVDGSSLHLQPGEFVSARDMLFALMLRSANDGCVAIAEHIAGSESKFAEMMTAKAREMGAANTVFRNANGLNDPPNVTTARDLAVMARYASRFPEFNEAVSSKHFVVSRSSDSKDVVLKNHAKFLWKFPGADGIKTGWTVPAGRCFVGSATWNGWRLISVVLNSPDVVEETSTLMKFGFHRFEQVTLADAGAVSGKALVHGGDKGSVPVAPVTALRYIVPKNKRPEIALVAETESLDAPVNSGIPAGRLKAVVGNRVLASVPLVVTSNVDRVTVVASVFGGGLTGVIFGAAFLGMICYGTTAAKAARIRRYRLKAIQRGANRARQGNR